MSKNIRKIRKHTFLGWHVEELYKVKLDDIATRLFYIYDKRIYCIAANKRDRVFAKNAEGSKKTCLHNWSVESSIDQLVKADRKNIKEINIWLKKKDFDSMK